MHRPQSASHVDGVALPRLPPEILAHILEIAILTSAPCPLNSASGGSSLSPDLSPSISTSSAAGSSSTPFSTPLAASSASRWSDVSNYLYVCRQFYSIVRPLLLRTLTLDRAAASLNFFQQSLKLVEQHQNESQLHLLQFVERAWLGNISALHRAIGYNLDPVSLRLHEAAWYHECPGGFVVGHAYATRPKHKLVREPHDERLDTKVAKSEKRYERVSVYWAEEELIREVRDPNASSSSSSSSSSGSASASEGETDQLDANDASQNRGSASHEISHADASGKPSSSSTASQSRPTTRRRSSNQLTGDPRIDRPHEPAWQTLYSVQRRTRRNLPRSVPSTRDNANNLADQASSSASRFTGVATGPSEGELDPWEMQEAQERLATLAAHAAEVPTAESIHRPIRSKSNLGSDDDGPGQIDDQGPASQDQLERRQMSAALAATVKKLRRRGSQKREIYAYHLCTATLEPWINTFLASIRTLRFITLTFYPGHILDDDKLEHMLRRILSSAENPKLEVLLIRMVFEPSVAGSRMRRFERAKTIGGAVDRIGDDRVRVMLVPNTVGNGTLSTFDDSASTSSEQLQNNIQPQQHQHHLAQSPQKQKDQHRQASSEPILNPLSRRAVQLTKDGWWSRVLQQNRSGTTHAHLPHVFDPDAPTISNHISIASASTTKPGSDPPQHAAKTGWQMFFGTERGKAEWMGKVVDSCNPWPDDPIHLEADLSKTSQSNAHKDTRNRQLQYLNGWAARDTTNSNAPIEE